MIEVPEVECLAGRGLRGDRYLDHKPDYKGQITFFALETHRRLCEQFGLFDKSPAVYRRNVIVSGQDLNAWIGCEFEVQGLRFFGTEAAKPCVWMDEAFAPGALEALHDRGGLRARILTDGTLTRTALA